MSRSIAAAEKAALDGEGAQWDTQTCMGLQIAVLSSPTSKPNSHDRVASPRPQFESLDNDLLNPSADGFESGVQAQPPENARVYPNGPLLRDTSHPNPSFAETELNAPPKHERPPDTRFHKRDANGRLRFCKIGSQGEEVRPENFAWKLQAAMGEEDPTQNGSISPTQPNSDSVYHHLDLHRVIVEGYPSTSTPEDAVTEGLPTQANADSLHSRYPSVHTESTALTFQEDDPRHIQLNFMPSVDEEANESQDHYAAPQPDPESQNVQTFEPQTPAQPVNPFLRKGNVLKVNELFIPTPTAVHQHFATPTSSPPSPDVYHGYSSPAQRRPMLSSPLQSAGFTEPETSPLQSSVRGLLASSTSTDQPFVPRASGLRSSDVLPRAQHEEIADPRPYTSMKESQERRNQEQNYSDLDSNGSDSDIEAVPKHRRIVTDRLIRRELSAVVGKAKQKVKISSRPNSSHSRTAEAPSNSLAIEVPSTGRRRSVQEEYIAQCEGNDTRDTQQSHKAYRPQETQETQDDIIADSQTRSVHEERLGTPKPAVTDTEIPASPTRENGSGLLQDSIQDVEQDEALDRFEGQAEPDEEIRFAVLSSRDFELDPDSNIAGNQIKTVQTPLHSLPLQELLSNRHDLRTPSKTQLSNSPDTVPETSPPEQRLRPMSEIASISFGRASAADELIDNLPGFTQDIEFENAMRLGSLPQAPQPRNFHKLNEHAPAKSDPGQEVHEKRQPSTSTRWKENSVTSSLLSDPPPTDPEDGEPQLVEQKFPEAENPDNDAPNVNIEDDTNATDLPESPIPSSPPVRASNFSLANKKRQESPHALSTSPRQSTRITKKYSKKAATSRSSLSRVSATRRTETPRSSPLRSEVTPDTAVSVPRASKQKSVKQRSVNVAVDTPVAGPAKHTAKRKSVATVVEDMPKRSSKRQSIARESSEDPLKSANAGAVIFSGMAFAVSYVNEAGREKVTKLILENGGKILQDGFEALFEGTRGQLEGDTELSLTASARALGFTALIADEYSRKAKYMQALALGLPCISGFWIDACINKGRVISWPPYLLSAGQSSILGNAIKSRTLTPYPAESARLEEIFSARDKLLDGRSVLLVTGKGKVEEKRRAYSFLAKATGPARIGQAVDLQSAKKMLTTSDAEDSGWDFLYVDNADENAAKSIVSSTIPSAVGSRKRKREAKATEQNVAPGAQKKIRVIADEVMMQSLILGQVIDD